MALAALTLDDVTWAELVDAARNQIAGASNRQWTHHSPVDPGVTLIELYAWLFDQRIYWLDRVSSSMKRAVLALLGVEPRPVGIAVGAFSIRGIDGVSAAPRVVPARTVLRVGRGPEAVMFQTVSEATYIPVEGIGITVAGVDRTIDLDGIGVELYPRPVRQLAGPSCDGCLPGSPVAVEPAFTLRLSVADALAGVGGTVALLLDLDGPRDRVPGWEPDLPSVDPAMRLSWQIHTASGWTEIDVEDGTVGLRRTGIVRFELSDQWVADADGDHLLRVEWIEGTPTVWPRLRRVLANAIVAEHVLDGTVRATVDWLPLPGNHLELETRGLGAGKLVPAAVRLRMWDGDDFGDADWSAADDLLFHGPESRVFTVDRDDSRLAFGDGIHGRIPRPAPNGELPNIRVRVQVGGGKHGQLPEALPFQMVDRNGIPADGSLDMDGADDEIEAVLAFDTRGGEEPEALDAAVRRAAREQKRRVRAVTAGDFELLATQVPGVEIRRALAQVGSIPGHACLTIPGALTLFVLPAAPRPGSDWPVPRGAERVERPTVDVAALESVARWIEERRLLGTEVVVDRARFQSVQLEVEVSGDITDEVALRRALTDRLRDYLDPLLGGPDGTGWPFGASVSPSELLDVAQQAAGRGPQVDRVAVALDDGELEDCVDVRIGEADLLALEAVRIRVRPTPIQGAFR